MVWLKEKIDTFVAKYIDNFFLSTKWSAKQALKSCDTTACAEAIWAGLDEDEKADPQIAALYEDAKARGEQNKDLGTFGGLSNALLHGFHGTFKEVIGWLPEAFHHESPALWDDLVVELNGMIKDKFDEVLEHLGIDDVEGRTKILGIFKDKVLPIVSMTLAFKLSGVIAEYIVPTSQKGWSGVSHVLHDTIGFKSMTRAYSDIIALNLIKTPLKYAMNTLTRPFAPDMNTAVNWYERGHIGDGQLWDLLTKQGVEPGWKKQYKRSSTSPISYFILNMIGESGAYEKDLFKFFLSDAGFGAFPITEDLLTDYEKMYGLPPPKDPKTGAPMSAVDFMIHSYEKLKVKWEYADIKSLTEGLFREGIFPLKWKKQDGTVVEYTDQAESYKAFLIDKALVSEDYAQLRLLLTESRMGLKEKEATRSANDALYRAGRLNEDEYRTRMKALKYSDDAIDMYLKLNDLKMDEEPKVLIRGQLERMLRKGVIDETEFTARMFQQKYSVDDIKRMVKDNLYDTVEEWFRAYETRTLNGRMSVEELQKKYVELGKTEGWAEARAAYIQEKLLGKEEAA